MSKIKDPRDMRRKLIMIEQRNMLGKDTSAWEGSDGEISVYRSTDSPRQGSWIHGLTMDNYKSEMEFN